MHQLQQQHRSMHMQDTITTPRQQQLRRLRQPLQQQRQSQPPLLPLPLLLPAGAGEGGGVGAGGRISVVEECRAGAAGSALILQQVTMAWRVQGEGVHLAGAACQAQGLWGVLGQRVVMVGHWVPWMRQQRHCWTWV